MAVVACLFLSPSGLAAPAHPSRFALVELFTSEGCSSCPPADQVLARLSADAKRSGDPVVALSFHVTYWNHLGWTERFSDEAFTRRQGAYAKRLGLRSVYTPQIVVDGDQEFVGSDEAAVERAVRAALSRSRATGITVKVHSNAGGIDADCAVTGAPEGSVLWVTWADAEDSSSPDRGENEGRQLHHVNVIRALERASIHAGASTTTVHVGRPGDPPGSVIAWVQHGDAGSVLAGSVTPVR